MIDDPQLRRLAGADPAAALDPPPSEDLLRRLLEQPRAGAGGHGGGARSSRGGHRRVRVAVAMVAVVLVAAGVALAQQSLGPEHFDPAAEAYAQTTLGPEQILHVVADTERTVTSPDGEIREAGTVEEWHRGTETHRIETFSKGGVEVAVDELVGSDGVLRRLADDGSVRTVRASDDDYPARLLERRRAGFVEEFRLRYEQGELDAAGDVRFAGRPARRYVVKPDDRRDAAAAPSGPEQAFFVDRDTGAPLGSTSRIEMDVADGGGDAVRTTVRFVVTVRTVEGLAPTRENLGNLTTFGGPVASGAG